jgi:transmembrane sensor
MIEPKATLWKYIGPTVSRTLEVLILVAVSLLRVDSDRWLPLPDSAWVPYSTSVGGRSHLLLQDGTSVDLNSGSEIQVRFTGQLREVLLTRGEALFSVAHRTNWPFSVRAGTATIHALGTRFSVRLLDNEQADILVLEGRVVIDGGHRHEAAKVAAPETAEPVSWSASAGEGISLKASVLERRAKLGTDTLRRKIAWIDGWLWFQEEPLPDAIAEFNRYHLDRVVMVDPRLSRLRIGGRFRSADLQSFISTLEKSFGVRATVAPVPETRRVIYLSVACRNARQQCNWPLVQ